MVWSSKSSSPSPCGNQACTEQGPIASRPLASNEELWWRAQPTGTGVCVTAFELQGSWSLTKVQSAATATAYRHPVLLSSIVSSKDKPELHICRPPSPIAVAVAPWPATSTDGGPQMSLVQLVERELNRKMEELSEGTAGAAQQGNSEVAVFQVRLYSSELSSAVILRTHSSAVDRHAAVTVAATFLDCLAGAGDEAASPSAATDITLPPPFADVTPSTVKPKSVLTKAWDMMGYVTQSLTSHTLPFQKEHADCRKNAFRSKLVTAQFTAQEVEKILSACSSNDCSLFGAECAAVLKATAGQMGLGKKSEAFAITSIINCRPYTEPPLDSHSVGVYDSGLPLRQAVAETSDFWELARSLSELATSAVERNGQFTELPVLEYLFSKALKTPSITPQHSFRTNYLTAFANAPLSVPWLSSPAARSSNGVTNLPLLADTGPIVSSHGVGPCLALPDFQFADGSLQLVFEFPVPLYAEDVVMALAKATRGILLSSSG